MSLGKLNCLAALGLLAVVSAGPQTAAPKQTTPPAGARASSPPGTAKPAPAVAAASAEDLSEHPEIITQDFNPQVVSLFGVKIGDSTSKVQAKNMDRLAGTLPGIMKLGDGNQLRYNPTTLTVTGLVVGGRNSLIKAKLLDRYDVEFRFGKPDISDDRHAVYLSRRLLFIYNSQDITQVEVR